MTDTADTEVAMCDIIEVEADDFMSRKDRVTVESVDTKIRTKIESLLSTYDCFTKEIQFFAPPSHNHRERGNGGYRNGHNHHHHQHNQHHHNNGQHSRGGGGRRYYQRDADAVPSARVAAIAAKNPIREVSGLLNKVTASTYHVLVQKLIRFCAYKECAVEVIGIIINKCYMHGNYSYLYHNILHEMYHRYAKEVKEATEQFATSFLEDLPGELERLQVQPHPVSEYEAFCVYAKRKKVLLDKLFNVIVINRKYKGDPALTERVWHILQENLEHVIRSRNTGMFDFLDLLSALIAILKKEKGLPERKSDELFFIYKDIKNAYSDLPKKIQFSWEKLAED